jgi:hypothetical protein
MGACLVRLSTSGQLRLFYTHVHTSPGVAVSVQPGVSAALVVLLSPRPRRHRYSTIRIILYWISGPINSLPLIVSSIHRPIYLLPSLASGTHCLLADSDIRWGGLKPRARGSHCTTVAK